MQLCGLKIHSKNGYETYQNQWENLFFCGHWDTLCPTDLHFFHYICDNRFMQRLIKITSSFAVFISTAVSLPDHENIGAHN